jgi:hypothetical protein
MNADTSHKQQLRRRDERFLSRQELAERWGISVREVIRREKHGNLQDCVYRFSFKMARFPLTKILELEQQAKVNPS